MASRACNRQCQRPLTRADIAGLEQERKNLDDDVGTAGTARPTVQLKPTRRRLFDKENFTTSTPKRGKKVNLLLLFLWTHAQRCVHVMFCQCFYIFIFYETLMLWNG